jgi:AcrR family transcriptional regulator
MDDGGEPMTAGAKLRREDFVEAAFELAQASGVHGFTMRSLGERMDLDPTTVYRYFSSKDALIVAMVGRMMSERVTPEMLSQPPRERILAMADVARTTLLENPEMTIAVVTVTQSSETMAASEIVIEALEELGLAGRDLVLYYQLLEGMIIGSILLDGGGAPENWQGRANRYRTFGIRPFTEVSKLGPEEVEAVATEAMRLGLSTILDAIEAAAG